LCKSDTVAVYYLYGTNALKMQGVDERANLLLNGVDVARQSVADCLVDDAEDERVQRAAGEQ